MVMVNDLLLMVLVLMVMVKVQVMLNSGTKLIWMR